MENFQFTDYNRVAFSLISPLCQEIIRFPTEENLLNLQSIIDQLSSESTQLYQRYICIPLCVCLVRKDVRLEVRRHLVESLVKIIEKTRIKEFDLFLRIFTEIFRLISDDSLQKIVPDASEELLLSVMVCATVLIANSSTKVLNELYSEKYVPLISHGIYFSLNIQNGELFLDLRLAAIKCLMHICQVHNGLHSIKLDLRIKVGNVLMQCLPGIIINLRKTISVDEKQNHRITMMAIRAWSRITAIVMEDYLPPERFKPNDDWVTAQLELLKFIENNKYEMDTNNSKQAVLNELKRKERTNEWYTSASNSMSVIIGEICHLYFPNWKVRQEMVSFAEILLLYCSRNMKTCVPSLIELLLILSEDDMPDISKSSKLVLSKFSDKFDIILVEVMENHFLKVMKKLCSTFQGEEDLKIHLNLMCGYMRLLGSNLNRIMKSSVHLNTLSLALIGVITLDYFIISPLEDWSLGTSNEDILKASIPWKCFKKFKNKQIFIKFKEICHLLCQHGDISIMSDHFLYHFHQDYENKKEITMIINEVFSNMSSSECEHISPAIKKIVASYLDPEVWEVMKVEDTGKCSFVKNLSFADIRNRTVQACLLVEGLGMLCNVAVSEKMKPCALNAWYFRMCLYPILERIGHPSPMLSGAGTLAMAHISHATKMSVPDIIKDNSDYLTHHIVLKIQHASKLSSSAPLNVLVAILELGTTDILVNLEEAILSIVNNGLKYENDQRVLDCLKCMYAFTKFVSKNFINNNTCEINKNVVKNRMVNENDKEITSNEAKIGIVTQKIIGYQRLRKIASGNPDDNQDMNEEHESIVEDKTHNASYIDNEEVFMEEPKPALPKHIALTIIIMKQCLTLISSRDNERKLMAMDILSQGIWVVQDHTNELLPLVHKIWGPLSVQFNDSDPLLMNRAFQLLTRIAGTAKDFIRDRTLKKVLPYLSKFLLKQASLSLKKDSGSSYRFSQAYKLQLTLLRGLGHLAINLDFHEEDLSELLTATSPYLSNLQPRPLQEACIETYKLASTINPDLVWLKLAYLGNIFQNLKPPSEEYQVYPVPIKTNFGEEVKTNVQMLINLIKINS